MCGMKLLIHSVSHPSLLQPLKVGNVQVIQSHTLPGMWLNIHVGIVEEFNHVSKICPWFRNKCGGFSIFRLGPMKMTKWWCKKLKINTLHYRKNLSMTYAFFHALLFLQSTSVPMLSKAFSCKLRTVNFSSFCSTNISHYKSIYSESFPLILSNIYFRSNLLQ